MDFVGQVRARLQQSRGAAEFFFSSRFVTIDRAVTSDRHIFLVQLADSQMKKDKKVLEDMDCETDESAGATPKDFARK